MREHIPFAQLSAYAENDMDEETAKALDSHLSLCELCRKEIGRIRFMLRMTRSLSSTDISLSDNFTGSVAVRLQSKKRNRRISHFYMPAAAAAVVLIIMGIGFLDTRHVTDPVSAPKTALNEDRIDFEDYVGPSIPVKSIHQIIEKNGGQIGNSNDAYVEAIIPVDGYQNVRSALGFTKLPITGTGNEMASSGTGTYSFNNSDNRSFVRIRIRRQ